MTFPKILTIPQIEGLPAMGSLIDEVIDEGSVTLLVGANSTLKSFIALSWACSVASGHSWIGREVTDPGVALYFAGEGFRSYAKRVRAWETYNNATVPSKNLGVGSGVPHLTPALLDPNAPFSIREEWTKFKSYIASMKPRLLVIDTLAKAIAGQESISATTMSVVDTLCRELIQDTPNLAIVIIAHFGKDESRGVSGSRAIEDSADTIYYTKRTAPGSFTESGRVQLSRKKRRDGEITDVHNLKLVLSAEHCTISPVSCVSEEVNQRVDEHRRLKAEGLTIREIAAQTGHSKSTVARDLKET